MTFIFILLNVAEAYGLPLLPPYLALKNGVKAEHGVNFAIAGATAIAAEYFYSKNITVLWTNISLTDQVGWFQEVKSNICATRKGIVMTIINLAMILWRLVIFAKNWTGKNLFELLQMLVVFSKLSKSVAISLKNKLLFFFGKNSIIKKELS